MFFIVTLEDEHSNLQLCVIRNMSVCFFSGLVQLGCFGDKLQVDSYVMFLRSGVEFFFSA